MIRPRLFQRNGFMAHVGFDKLKSKIQKKEGYSAKRAAAVAASVGMKKLGKKAFEKKAQAGRKKAAKKGK